MAYRRPRNPSHALTAKAFELSMAAPQVIAHRVSRMALAGASPSMRDQREFSRMGTEKVNAFFQSWMAMCSQAFQVQFELTLAWSSLPWLMFGGNPASLRKPLAQSRNAMIKVLTAGIEPVRATAVANSKRLYREARS